MSRRASLRNAPRNDDLFFTTTSTTTIVEPGIFDKYEISVVYLMINFLFRLKILFEQEVIIILGFNLILMVYVTILYSSFFVPTN